jgi:hypothetical protein
MIDTGTLIWLHAVHGVEPLDLPEFTQWNTDIRVIADSVLNEQNQDKRHIIPTKSQGFFQTPQDIMEKYNGCSVPQYTA